VSDTPEIPYHHQLKNRFRGYFPVIIDVETAGFDAKKDALLELAAITLKMDENGNLQPDQKCHFHIEPFEGANINPESLKFNGIDIHNPLRGAVSELDAITGLFQAERTGVKRNPFHPFGMFDTATLAGFMFGQTVLVKACQAAKIPFDGKQAHSALYDTERTAELFCYMVNHLKELGGFPHIAQTNETEKTAENQTAL